MFEVIYWPFHISLLLLVLSVGYYVAQVFVVQVSGNIKGEVGEHLVHLKETQVAFQVKTEVQFNSILTFLFISHFSCIKIMQLNQKLKPK